MEFSTCHGDSPGSPGAPGVPALPAAGVLSRESYLSKMLYMMTRNPLPVHAE
jgi:hypothetical protein